MAKRRLKKGGPAGALAQRRWAKQDANRRSIALSKTAKGRMTKMTGVDRSRVAKLAGQASGKARKKS